MKLLASNLRSLALLAGIIALPPIAAAQQADSRLLPAKTALDDYVHKPDDSYRWKVVTAEDRDGVRLVVIDMISQTWRTPEEVDRTQWQHWLTCAVPDQAKASTGLLMIGGGSNRGRPPAGPDEEVIQLARLTNSVVCELKMVPNQPLIFHDDGQPRYEDDLIGYTWDQYLQTGDATWLARNPMIKSAVRAMDTITAMMASDTGGGRTVDKFVVAGGSKRGWTTWLTGAIDKRVVGIIPIVIDVLNVDPSMRHHFAAYGYWAPSVGDYVRHRIMERMTNPRLQDAYRLIDPYYYRHRLTKPKFLINAAGDEFFLPDSSQFYWDDLQGPKYLRYVPNSGHSLGGSDAMASVAAFYGLLLAGRQPPHFRWTEQPDGAFRIEVQERPREVRLWQATNPSARDFRVETLGRKYRSETIDSQDDGTVYLAHVKPPEKGWTAYFVELTYDVGLPTPLKLTTNVRVVPDVLPYADKPLDLPASVTIVAQAPSPEQADLIVRGVQQLVREGKFPGRDLSTKTTAATLYLNWRPAPARFREEAAGLSKFLADQGCEQIRYQLESGLGITELSD